jgi:YD repeat-containing protein
LRISASGDSLHFFYNTQGKPSVVGFNGTKYGYAHNLQGVIIANIDGSDTQAVEHTYDAWGKPLAKTSTLEKPLGTLNPFRYRSYVYDEETGRTTSATGTISPRGDSL